MKSSTPRGQSRLPQIEGELIFEASWAGSLIQKATSLSLSALFWSVWVSMWLPLVTYFAWLVGPWWGLSQLGDSAADNLLTLGLIAATGVFLGSALSLWGTVQWYFKTGQPSASLRPEVCNDKLCEFHGLSREQLDAAWTHRRLVIHHDVHGGITQIETSMEMASRCLVDGQTPGDSAYPASADGADVSFQVHRAPAIGPAANDDLAGDFADSSVLRACEVLRSVDGAYR